MNQLEFHWCCRQRLRVRAVRERLTISKTPAVLPATIVYKRHRSASFFISSKSGFDAEVVVKDLAEVTVVVARDVDDLVVEGPDGVPRQSWERHNRIFPLPFVPGTVSLKVIVTDSNILRTVRMTMVNCAPLITEHFVKTLAFSEALGYWMEDEGHWKMTVSKFLCGGFHSMATVRVPFTSAE